MILSIKLSLLFIIQIYDVFGSIVYKSCVAELDKNFNTSATAINDGYHFVYYTTPCEKLNTSNNNECIWPNPSSGVEEWTSLSDDSFNSYVNNLYWKKYGEGVEYNNYNDDLNTILKNVVKDCLNDEVETIKDLDKFIKNKLKDDKFEKTCPAFAVASAVYEILGNDNSKVSNISSKNKLTGTFKYIIESMTNDMKIELLASMKEIPEKINNTRDEFGFMEESYLIGCDGENKLEESINKEWTIGCSEKVTMNGVTYEIIKDLKNYECKGDNFRVLYWLNNKWIEKPECVFDINKSSDKCVPSEECKYNLNGLYILSEDKSISEEGKGPILIYYDGESQTCNVFSKEEDSGIKKLDTIITYEGSEWNESDCSSKIGDGYIINSSNKKQVISCNSDNSVTVKNGSVEGEMKYYINKAGNKNTKRLIECKDNKECTTVYGDNGYYVYGGDVGVIRCIDEDCKIIKINEYDTKLFVNKGRDKDSKPLIECIKNKCSTSTASFVGYQITDDDGILIECISKTRCNEISDPIGYYLLSDGNGVIKCENDHCYRTFIGVYEIEYYINNGDDKNKKPIILCINKTCLTTKAPAIGYYLNSGEKSLSNGLIYCETTSNCYLVDGNEGTAYINQSENSNVDKNYSIIQCYNGKCEENYAINKLDYFIDGSSKDGDFYRNIIHVVNKSLISFEFMKNKYNMEDGYYINSVARGSLKDGIILCENKDNNTGKCRIITPEFGDSFKSGHDKFILCKRECKESELTDKNSSSVKYDNSLKFTKEANNIASGASKKEVESGKYFIDSATKKLVKCNENNVCNKVESSNGFYVYGEGESKLIECANEECTIIESNKYLYDYEYKYLINNGEDKDKNPLIRCSAKLCESMEAPAVGYYLNGENLLLSQRERENFKNLSNGLIACESTTLCYKIDGINGASYINKNECNEEVNIYYCTYPLVISCFEGKCQEKPAHGNDIFVDGGSKDGNYFTNIITAVKGSLISFKFEDNEQNMNNGYYLNSGNSSSREFGIILCEDKENGGKCKLITPEEGDTFRTGHDKFINCKDHCIQSVTSNKKLATAEYYESSVSNNNNKDEIGSYYGLGNVNKEGIYKMRDGSYIQCEFISSKEMECFDVNVTGMVKTLNGGGEIAHCYMNREGSAIECIKAKKSGYYIVNDELSECNFNSVINQLECSPMSKEGYFFSYPNEILFECLKSGKKVQCIPVECNSGDVVKYDNDEESTEMYTCKSIRRSPGYIWISIKCNSGNFIMHSNGHYECEEDKDDSKDNKKIEESITLGEFFGTIFNTEDENINIIGSKMINNNGALGTGTGMRSYGIYNQKTDDQKNQ